MGGEVPYYNPFFVFEQIYLLLRAIKIYLLAIANYFPWANISFLLGLLSLLFVALMLVIYFKVRAIKRSEKESFMAMFEEAKDPQTEKNEEWKDIVDHTESDNESQWKLAIIDADKILEDALRAAQYSGVGVGELLKDAESKHGFNGLQDAWEAHKIRNRIAHESGFELTKREARRAVELYKTALHGLHYM